MADPAAFFETYVRGGRPVRVKDLLSADGALRYVRKVLTRASLLQRLGESTWEVGDIPYEGRYTERTRAPMKLREYVEAHLDGCADEKAADCTRHPYVFAERFHKGTRGVSVDKEKLVPRPSWATGRVQPGTQTQFYLGGALSGAPFHFHQSAYNLLVFGRKRWYLTPPAHAVFSMRPAKAWLAEQLPKLRAANATSLHVCDQAAGDLLIVPDLWGHLTYNLETSIGIAQEFAYM